MTGELGSGSPPRAEAPSRPRRVGGVNQQRDIPTRERVRAAFGAASHSGRDKMPGRPNTARHFLDLCEAMALAATHGPGG